MNGCVKSPFRLPLQRQKMLRRAQLDTITEVAYWTVGARIKSWNSFEFWLRLDIWHKIKNITWTEVVFFCLIPKWFQSKPAKSIPYILWDMALCGTVSKQSIPSNSSYHPEIREKTCFWSLCGPLFLLGWSQSPKNQSLSSSCGMAPCSNPIILLYRHKENGKFQPPFCSLFPTSFKS